MTFTNATINPIEHLPLHHGATTDSVGDEPRENPNATTSLDGPRRESAVEN
jgi:hypothetical protein